MINNHVIIYTMEKRLSVVAILLLVTLGCQGAVDDSYFMRRSKMLNSAPVNFYPQAEDSKTDKTHYKNSAPIPHNYKLLINEADMCYQHPKVFLLVLIMGYYPNFRWRGINREQLKHRSRLLDQKGLVVKYVFLFGASSDPSVMKLIKQESDKYHDIVQENFLESYINASLKVAMGYKWAVNHCPNTEYVIVAEDELSFDIDKIASFLLKDRLKTPNDDHFAICYPVENDRPMHKAQPKYTGLDPKALYRGNYYPPYCRGFGYAAHIKVINKLYRASLVTPSFVPSEAWIGIMAEKLRLKIPNNKQLFIEENLEAYHADPKYPDLPGAIAVPNSRGYRGYEIESLKSIIKSMRRHWKKNQYPQGNIFQKENTFQTKKGIMGKSKDTRDKMVPGENNKLKVPGWKSKGTEMGKVKGNGLKNDEMFQGLGRVKNVDEKRVKVDKPGMKPVKIDRKINKDNIMDTQRDKTVKTNYQNENGFRGETKKVKMDRPGFKPVKSDKQKPKDDIRNKWRDAGVRAKKMNDNGVKLDRGENKGIKMGDKKAKMNKQKDTIDTWSGKKFKTDKLSDNGIKLNEGDKRVDRLGNKQIKTDKQKNKENIIDSWRAKGIEADRDRRIKPKKEDKKVKGGKQIDNGIKGGVFGNKIDKGKKKMVKPKVKPDKIDRGKFKKIKTDKQKDMGLKATRNKYAWVKTDKWKGRQDKSLYMSHVRDPRKEQPGFGSVYVYLFVAFTCVLVLVFRKQILNLFARLYNFAVCFKNK